jgi:hypothetical protein
MHVHLPKPLHGWREFLGEVSIIVLGVLIALGAEQMLDDWRWHNRARTAIETLKNESSLNFRFAAEQVAVDGCVDQQLAWLHDRLLSGGASLPVPLYTEDLGNGQGQETYVFRHPSRPWKADVWHSVNDDGTAAHFDNFQHHLLGMVYAQVASLQEFDEATNVADGQLAVLAEPVRIDPASVLHFLGLISEQRRRNS